ncbi:uncharacterized protein PAC_05004 [Phialocephala subalpina]|uniref:RBR-type E3 ubiquitin transferase n=1 Tax=Phialocephala subalpina TaxID=576137 RepID=A0A1L7WQR9_9HELO|nr:uncharacterized protein PAC_05004 [Phialocephala subalpina]
MAPPTAAPTGVFDTIDPATSTLILKLQIQDIDQLLGANNNEAELSGWQETLLAQKEELQRSLSIIRDRRVTMGIAYSVAQDIKAVNALVAEERQAEDDRAMACRLAGLPVPPRRALPDLSLPEIAAPRPANSRPASSMPTPADSVIPPSTQMPPPPVVPSNSASQPSFPPQSSAESPNALFYWTGGRKRSKDDEDDQPPQKRVQTENEAVIDLTKSPTPEKPTTLPCVSCSDDFEVASLAHMECEHDYCQECLQRVVVNALNDEACYPPRCCKKPFQMDSMRYFLTPEIISGFHEKKVEFETANRLYCSNPTCSTFLYPACITGDKAECPICLVSTCTICKGATHTGDCPQDTGVQQVLTLANGEGWRRCSKCKAVVELGIGCNHITCRCKAEWCYVCGANWKTCQCPTWSEARLLGRAEQIADPIAPPVAQVPQPLPPPPAPRPQQVAVARQCHHGYACKRYRLQGWAGQAHWWAVSYRVFRNHRRRSNALKLAIYNHMVVQFCDQSKSNGVDAMNSMKGVMRTFNKTEAGVRASKYRWLSN